MSRSARYLVKSLVNRPKRARRLSETVQRLARRSITRPGQFPAVAWHRVLLVMHCSVRGLLYVRLALALIAGCEHPSQASVFLSGLASYIVTCSCCVGRGRCVPLSAARAVACAPLGSNHTVVGHVEG